MIAAFRPARPFPKALGAAIVGGLLLAGGAVVVAQLERAERGVAPIDSSANFEVGGVEVDVSGPNADAARNAGWRLAQRKAWKLLWARANGQPATAAPGLPDSTLDAIVAGIEVEDEHITPRRYVARLGVLFDRARAGQLLGNNGGVRRSAPMLVIPVMWSGGTGQSFETRTEWQRAWARFRSGGSPIDYIRPVGNGADPLLLNASQVGRPGRGQWRALLDQYGAADMVMPVVRLTRSFPGGPVIGQFYALHGPDAKLVGAFRLFAPSSDGLAKMLDDGVRRIDALYGDALRGGGLQPDASLTIEEDVADDLMAGSMAEDVMTDTSIAAPPSILSVQVDTPDATAAAAAEQTIRSIGGVTSASTSSLALGGVSMIRVTYAGDPTAFRAALQTRLNVRAVNVEQAGGPPRPAPIPLPPPPAAGIPPR
ncbi:heavy-metal-associated domain-containing protein [Sphingomonas naphthae]|uniref:Heavy-metal-associated domain-containing protein n=1 Tax=Sphingomonas naphthae TaxID=1813468 RepID=A0ABY7TPQ1_9SPHN|nr:heavy-metal-associated domain-containing protein [Sphingomonas naphthae]WCT75211.1 heavy-metal-associated domain-containing protein [Sphingomonas naphthae]